MNASWLEVLSNIDKMVLGSIVGSVVLAFFLLVVIFSLKIKWQHDQMVALNEALDVHKQEVVDQKETIAELKDKISEAQAVMSRHQDDEKRLESATTAIREKLEHSQVAIRTLSGEVERLNQEKLEWIATEKKAKADLLAAHKEIETVIKRNEYWVEKLSELRSRHDTLKRKLRSIGSADA